MREQRRLAYYAHATALAMNMHLYWVGVAADLWRAGDRSLEWMLRGAAGGEVFAAGHAERGNDMPLFLSTTKAERVAGGYRFTGHKSFGSLTPVWTYLGLHAMDTSDPAAPKIVHAFMPRATEGYSIKETWDVLGMRATASQDTVLQGAFVPDKYIARVVAAGFKGADLFILALFAWALGGFANVYYGLARRVVDLTVDNLKSKTSIAISRGSLTYHPEVQHSVADMVIELEGIGPPDRSPRRRLDPGRGPRRRLAGEDRGDQAPDGRSGVEDRGHGARPRRRLRDLRRLRDGAAVPRRPAQPDSPGQLRPDPRGRRQADARDRSRRPAALGVIGGCDGPPQS